MVNSETDGQLRDSLKKTTLPALVSNRLGRYQVDAPTPRIRRTVDSIDEISQPQVPVWFSSAVRGVLSPQNHRPCPKYQSHYSNRFFHCLSSAPPQTIVWQWSARFPKHTAVCVDRKGLTINASSLAQTRNPKK